MNQKEILLKNIAEFIKEAKEAAINKSFNSSVTLYFKALVVIADYHILVNEGSIPKNHTERFNILRTKYRLIYEILDKDFPIYQNSYRIALGKSYCEVLENDTKKLIAITKINLNI
ncbi:MAG: hypothetical protein U9R34_08120 [Nanoarchaeota archaeon]|nr:hypothetical protein [Nanoarchaeota archaeon]